MATIVLFSAIAFADGAVIAQLGIPDMRVPIGYAMSYPRRLTTGTGLPDLFAEAGNYVVSV